jgi:hypothetical protein
LYRSIGWRVIIIEWRNNFIGRSIPGYQKVH